MKVAYHDDFLRITQTPGHPECPERLSGIMGYLDENRLKVERLEFEKAVPEDVLAVHSQELVDFLKDFEAGTMFQEPFADTFYHPHTYEMALLAAGGGIGAANHAYAHREPTFALLRPPGHHATRFQSGGFCYINNIAVAAQHLLKKAGKVAIVDIDVHHGNGTHDIFLDRKDVLFISTHQWGIYPGTGPADQTGTGDGSGFTVNIPLGAHSGDSTFGAALNKIILPILTQFGPDAILVSLGADAHYLDPLASLTLSSKGYLEIMTGIAKFAEEECENRWSVFLEGGYHIPALADVVGSSLAMASGTPVSTGFNEVSDTETIGARCVSEAIEIQSKHWNL